MLQNFWYQVGRWIVWVYMHWIMGVDVYREAALPKGAKILAANHPSTNDPAFVTALSGEQMTILIKETVFKVPLFGRSLRMAGHVPVVRGSGGQALEEGIRLLKAGRTVVIFPEGEISPEGAFHAPHSGVARLALATGVPVVPVGISLDGKRVQVTHKMIDGAQEPVSWYLRGPYGLTVGAHAAYHGSHEDRQQVRQVSEQIMQQIILLSRRGDQRLGLCGVHPRGLAPARKGRFVRSLPRATYRFARRGAWMGYERSTRFAYSTSALRIIESMIVLVMMFSRPLTV
jgi:1-acyl-sn-glycerol-3-phosphate acyltransferase